MTTSIYIRSKNFIEKSKVVHNNKYDYSKVIYNHSQEKVKIICPIHGVFEQRPASHIRGDECIDCSGSKKLSTATFTEKANIVHSNRYNYSKVLYKNNKSKVELICHEHGSFWQKADSHLRGIGCRRCFDMMSGVKTRKTDLSANDYCAVYEIKLTGNGETFYKIGISKEINNRHYRINKASGYKIELLNLIHDTRYNCEVLAEKLQRKRQRERKYTPLIKFAGWTECYV